MVEDGEEVEPQEVQRLITVQSPKDTVIIRARQLKIYFQGSRVGGNIDQIEPLRLGPMSFGLKLMDRGHFEVLKMH